MHPVHSEHNSLQEKCMLYSNVQWWSILLRSWFSNYADNVYKLNDLILMYHSFYLKCKYLSSFYDWACSHCSHLSSFHAQFLSRMHQAAFSLWSEIEIRNRMSEPEVSKWENVMAWTHLRMNEERFAKKVLTIEIIRKHPWGRLRWRWEQQVRKEEHWRKLRWKSFGKTGLERGRGSVARRPT
jgi:hypothetical protein